MKTTVFSRMLLATLGSLLIVFTSILAATSNIVYELCSSFALQMTSWEAEHVAGHLTEKLDGVFRILEASAKRLEVDFESQDEATVRRVAEGRLVRLLDIIPGLQNVWVSCEPSMVGNGFVGSTLVRDKDRIRKLENAVPEILKNLDKVPWDTHQASPRLYVDMVGKRVYGTVTREKPGFSVIRPLVRDGSYMGAFGGVVHYENMFNDDLPSLINEGQLHLIAADGRIYYSHDKELEGKNIFDLPFEHAVEVGNALLRREFWTGTALLPNVADEVLAYLKPVKSYGIGEPLFLYLTTPVKNIYSMARLAVKTVVYSGILGFLLLGFSVYVATRSVVRPIRRLSRDFEKVSSGSVEYTSDISAGKREGLVELDILQNSLTKMLRQLSQTHELRLKAMEDRLEKEEMQAAMKARSEFFARMSHEIRTPMNAITGIAEILLHQEHLSEQDRKHVHDIKVSAEYLLVIVNDILDFSKIEAGTMSLTEADFSFRRFLENIRATGEVFAARKRLNFHYREDTELPGCLHMDEMRLRQLLLIFLGNACKFTSEGGIIFAVSADETSLTFVVSDTGVGLKEAELACIFEPFKRIDGVGESALSGTGLGLSIASGLLERMGGTVAVESDYGRGCTFTLTVPKVLGEQCEQDQEAGASLTVYRPGVRILVVDDNEINLAVSGTLLQELYSFECDLVNSGDEALQKCAESEYHLIFMDQMMPTMDGQETTQRIRKMGGRYAALPIIALTANAVEGARESLLASGMDDYLTKPVQVEELDAILARWISDEWKAP